VASDQDNQNGISRRDFTARVGAAAAGLALGGEFFRASAQTSGRIIGANDRVVTASIGIRGQGNALKRGFARVKGVEIKTLCDIDANLAPSRINDSNLSDVSTFKPTFVQDLRRVLDDKDIDAVVIATPNHWHALATIWALQAGKHVYVEKPASHTIWEGRRMVEAAARYGKVVQVGTMNRSRPAVRQAIKFMQDGGIGKVYMARGLCFKPRLSIGKYPDGPMATGEKFALTTTSKNFEPTYDAEYLSKVDYDLWLGPAPERPFNPNRFHYEWHWNWDYGNGDLGNQGAHQIHSARTALGVKYPTKISSMGGHYVFDDDQETPNTLVSSFEFDDAGKKKLLVFEVRHWMTNNEAGIGERAAGQSQAIGNIWYGSKGYLATTNNGWQTFMGKEGAPGPKSEADPGWPGFTNFIDVVRSRKREDQLAEVEEGAISTTLIHLANISYRTGRTLYFDPVTYSCKGDAEATAMFTRGQYRSPFAVPNVTGSRTL
jgi:predicted dehydrogenase